MITFKGVIYRIGSLRPQRLLNSVMNYIKEKSCLAAFIKTVTSGLSTNSQVRATLNGIKNGTTGKYCSLSFQSNGHNSGFDSKTKS